MCIYLVFTELIYVFTIISLNPIFLKISKYILYNFRIQGVIILIVFLVAFGH